MTQVPGGCSRKCMEKNIRLAGQSHLQVCRERISKVTGFVYGMVHQRFACSGRQKSHYSAGTTWKTCWQHSPSARQSGYHSEPCVKQSSHFLAYLTGWNGSIFGKVQIGTTILLPPLPKE